MSGNGSRKELSSGRASLENEPAVVSELTDSEVENNSDIASADSLTASATPVLPTSGGVQDPTIESPESTSTVAAKYVSLLETSLEKISKAAGASIPPAHTPQKTKWKQFKETRISAEDFLSSFLPTRNQTEAGSAQKLDSSVKSSPSAFAPTYDKYQAELVDELISSMENCPSTSARIKITPLEDEFLVDVASRPVMSVSKRDQNRFKEHPSREGRRVNPIQRESQAGQLNWLQCSPAIFDRTLLECQARAWPTSSESSTDSSSSGTTDPRLLGVPAQDQEILDADCVLIRSIEVPVGTHHRWVRRQCTGPLAPIGNFLLACQNMSLKTTDSIALVPIQLLLGLAAISGITMGYLYLNACPMAQIVPLLILIMGCVGLLMMILRMTWVIYDCNVGQPRYLEKLKCVFFTLTVAFLILFSCEMSLFYNNYTPDGSEENCDPIFYEYCYVLNWSILALLALSVAVHGPAFLYNNFRIGRPYVLIHV